MENDPRYTSDMKLIVYGFPDYSLEWLPYFNKTNNYAHWGMLWSDDFYTAVGWNVIFQHYIDGSVRWGSWDEINSIIMSEEYRAMVPKNGKVNTEIINGIFVVKF